MYGPFELGVTPLILGPHRAGLMFVGERQVDHHLSLRTCRRGDPSLDVDSAFLWAHSGRGAPASAAVTGRTVPCGHGAHGGPIWRSGLPAVPGHLVEGSQEQWDQALWAISPSTVSEDALL